MLPVITYLDLETTGATPLKDRITEIGLVRVEHGIEVARWQTLVNPEQRIAPFIQELTSISNEMVADAPTFAEVAKTLEGYLDGAVMAAHNAKFDLGFLKSEYKRLGHKLKQPVLCTVKLSRQLYPQFPKHGLSVIMERHNLTTDMRHRAMGDVELMLGFVASAAQELGIKRLEEIAKKITKQPNIPPGISAALVDGLPESRGVYTFYDEHGCPLYIDKNINIREGVLSHFNRDKLSPKAIQLSQALKHISFTETVGELGALLLEMRLIKTHQPIHNNSPRKIDQLCAWQIAQQADTNPLVKLVQHENMQPEMLDELFGTFKSKSQAIEALKKIAAEYKLCLKLLGLETGSGPCFASQLKACNGACVGKEDKNIHHLKLQQALSKKRLKSWPFSNKVAIKEHNKFTGDTDIHVFDQWCYLGTASNHDDYTEILNTNTVLSFDLDTYQLLLKIMTNQKYDMIEAAQTVASDW